MDKIAKLRTDYQSDSGNRAVFAITTLMLCRSGKKEYDNLKETAPLVEISIHRYLPLCFCALIFQSGNIRR